MANRRREPVTYRPFRTEPVLAEGLLAVARPGGEFLDRVASAMFGLAAQAGEVARADATRRGALAGQQAAIEGAPRTDVNAPAAAAGGNAAWRDAIASIESQGSGDYRAVGPRHPKLGRALGRYQVMEANVGPWSEKHLGRRVTVEEFMASPEIQDAIFDGEFGSYVKRFKSPSIAAQAWFAGPGGVGRTDRRDSLGTSVGGYAQKFDRAMQRLGGARPGGAASAPGGAARPPAGAASPPEMAGLGVTSQSGGTFRPRPGNTAYDRAYNEAGVRTYVQKIETEMRDTAGQLFERFKDDPAGLEQALEANRRDMAQRHIFPEIMADFDIGYDNLASRYLGQARDNLARKVEEQDRAEFYSRTTSLETDRARRLAGYDPDNPDMADTLAASQKAIDDHYDAAVSRGILSAPDAEKAKATSRREGALAFYGKQAEALSADGVKAMRAELKTDFAEGGVEGLDGDGYAALDAGLERLEKTKRAEAENATQAFRVRGDKMVARIGAGFEIDQAEMSQLMLDSGRTPQGRAALDETLAKISDARAMRDLTVAEGQAFLTKLRASMGDAPSDSQLRRLASAGVQLDDKRKAIAADQLAYAESRNLVPRTPLLTEAKSTEEVASILEARLLSAPKAAAELGVSPRYLKAGEAKAIGALIRQDPANGAALAGAIVAGSGDRAGQVLAEFGDDAPIVAEAGAILALGGSPQAARDVIEGYGKGSDGKALKGMKPATQRESFRALTGDSLALADRDRARIDRAAAAIARKRIAEDGLDPEGEEALEVHRRAVHEAAGAVFDRGVQYGGFSDVRGAVLVPGGVRADMFEDVLEAVTDEDLAGLKQKPRPGVASWWSGKEKLAPSLTLRRARPVAVAGGYAFAYGEPDGDDPQFVQGDDGEIFVLDIMALRDRLAARVPGAFR